MKNYRVFVARHYIAGVFYDIKAKDKRTAKRVARKTAKKLLPDVRKQAIDNGWIANEPVEIRYLGYASVPFRVKQVFKDKETKVYKGE